MLDPLCQGSQVSLSSLLLRLRRLQGFLLSLRRHQLKARHRFAFLPSLARHFVYVATVAPPNRRARCVFRGTALGAVLELVLGASAGMLCDDIAGYLFIGGMEALPMALVAIAVRRWAMHGVPDQSGN